ncbi:MAG: hypothetical protein IPK83_18160 [Planctomycetes bacterium]|nr:hypothetical protein [Planctomycetota bacterium]
MEGDRRKREAYPVAERWISFDGDESSARLDAPQDFAGECAGARTDFDDAIRGFNVDRVGDTSC